MNRVVFMGMSCEVRFSKYVDNDRTAIVLYNNDGSLMTKATVNLDIPMEPDEVAIRDYSENEGMLNVLVAAGIVSEPIRREQSGFVMIPICKLLVKERGAG